ncbi:MAG: NAD(P)-dependent oxidoreductase [Nanoarchaeota archaeon]|nr:NAD(P)-dependent oxidoreductase [Nanoarchaeota archaeon]
MERILITGGSGQIGSRVVERLSEIFYSGEEIHLLKREREIKSVDPRYAGEVKMVDRLNENYDFTFHLAANIHTKYNQNPQWLPKFKEDNVELTRKVADNSGRVLLVSSDNVFSGSDGRDYTEEDISNPNPLNTYGVTKAEAERIVLNKGGDVIRIQTMLGVKSNLIVNRVMDAIEGKDYWPFWNDTFSKPSYFEDFFEVAKSSYNLGNNEVYHVSTNGEPLSRAQIAYKVLEVYQKNNLPVQRGQFNTENCNDINFPRRLVLDSQITQTRLGLKFASVDEALENHVLYVKD